MFASNRGTTSELDRDENIHKSPPLGKGDEMSGIAAGFPGQAAAGRVFDLTRAACLW